MQCETAKLGAGAGLADEKRETILVACSKSDWRAAFSRDDLIASHGADYAMPNLLNHLAALIGIAAAPLRGANRGRPTPRVGRVAAFAKSLAAGVERRDFATADQR
jgi:hypothetical protein